MTCIPPDLSVLGLLYNCVLHYIFLPPILPTKRFHLTFVCIRFHQAPCSLSQLADISLNLSLCYSPFRILPSFDTSTSYIIIVSIPKVKPLRYILLASGELTVHFPQTHGPSLSVSSLCYVQFYCMGFGLDGDTIMSRLSQVKNHCLMHCCK